MIGGHAGTTILPLFSQDKAGMAGLLNKISKLALVFGCFLRCFASESTWEAVLMPTLNLFLLVQRKTKPIGMGSVKCSTSFPLVGRSLIIVSPLARLYIVLCGKCDMCDVICVSVIVVWICLGRVDWDFVLDLTDLRNPKLRSSSRKDRRKIATGRSAANR